MSTSRGFTVILKAWSTHVISRFIALHAGAFTLTRIYACVIDAYAKIIIVYYNMCDPYKCSHVEENGLWISAASDQKKLPSIHGRAWTAPSRK